MSVELALVAVALEAIVGYPDAVYRAIGHPVTWIGRLIAWCDATWNSPDQTPDERRLWGVATLVLLVVVSVAVGRTLEHLLPMVLCAILGSSLIAQRSHYTHVAAVAESLETGGLEAGRKAVSMIVGRDPEQLDEAGVGRAAIESLAENFSDGIVAPLFWLAVAGLPGGIAYKAVNTADSMIALADRGVGLCRGRLAAARLADRVARRQVPSLAQCRLAGGRDGGCARPQAQRAAHL